MFFFSSATDTQTPSALQLLAKPGRLGLCVGFPESFEASNLKISFCTAQTLQNLEEFGNIQRNRYDDTKMSNRNSHQRFRIANSSDGRRYKSDFTTIKKMADFSYMKIVPGRAKHFG